MLDESLYRLYVSPNMFHRTRKSIYSLIQCQIKDDDVHALPVILSELVDSGKATPR